MSRCRARAFAGLLSLILTLGRVGERASSKGFAGLNPNLESSLKLYRKRRKEKESEKESEVTAVLRWMRSVREIAGAAGVAFVHCTMPVRCPVQARNRKHHVGRSLADNYP